MNNFYQKYMRISVLELTISSVFLSLYIIFGLFPIIIPGVMQVGFDFVILSLMGLLLGPFKGVFLCIISDFITLLIKGIAFWMWQYQAINIGIVLLSSIFIYIINLESKKWVIYNIFIGIMVFLSFYATIIIISIFPNYVSIKEIIKISIIVISLICLGVYICFIMYYLKTRKSWSKNIITFFSLSSLLLIIFSWILGPVAYIAFLNRISTTHTSLMNYPIFLIPRIIKSFFEIPIYTIIIFTTYDLLINKLRYRDKNKNKYNH